MLDLLRTVMLAGLGAVDLSEEKLRQVTDELVRRGELAADEARALAATYASRTAERRRVEAQSLAVAVAEELGRQNVASQAAVVELSDRIRALENGLAALRAGAAHGDAR